MAEYCSSGIWAFDDNSVGPFRHGMIEYDDLKLPLEIKERFEKWIDVYEMQLNEKELDIKKFNEEGKTLAHLLKKHVGKDRYVEFQGESREDGLLEPIEID